MVKLYECNGINWQQVTPNVWVSPGDVSVTRGAAGWWYVYCDCQRIGCMSYGTAHEAMCAAGDMPVVRGAWEAAKKPVPPAEKCREAARAGDGSTIDEILCIIKNSDPSMPLEVTRSIPLTCQRCGHYWEVRLAKLCPECTAALNEDKQRDIEMCNHEIASAPITGMSKSEILAWHQAVHAGRILGSGPPVPPEEQRRLAIVECLGVIRRMVEKLEVLMEEK